MDDNLDSGLFYSKYLKINNNTYIKDIYDWLDAEIPNLASEIVVGLKNDKVIAKPQSKNIKDIIHCFPRKPIDSKIDWHKGRDNILALIKASSHPLMEHLLFRKRNKGCNLESSRLQDRL